ncbi:MAG: 50S ribosome-binding GTPase [Candidatus Peribacteria bacterium]|nr:50S ribosome-binding GTPase [Candidatus Peribacteria bacterium]
MGQFRAIVTDIPGTTTDIIHHKLQLKDGETLTFLDSPGLLDFTDELPYIEHIVKESDLLLFLVDDTVGITAKERHILDLIRKTRKLNATILVVNKLDVKRKENETDLALTDYYDLGIANVIGISAKKERNLGNLLPLLKGDKGGSNNTLTKEEFLPHSQNPPPFGHPPYACPAQSCGEGGQ